MVLSREEKEKMVLDLYNNKSYTYKQLTRELRMSPNQIREIIKRHEEKNNDDAIANKKKELSLSSQAYKLFYEGKNNVEVAIMLDLPQEQVTKFRLEYWRLQNQDEFESLYMLTKGKLSDLRKIYNELVIKRGMSIEEVASALDINLNILPDMERELDQTCKALAKKQVDLDILKEEENRIRNRIVTLPPSSYHYVDNPATNAFPYYSASRQSPSLPYWPSGYPDLTNDYGDALKKGLKRKEGNSWDV